jgi:hypothetical protein
VADLKAAESLELSSNRLNSLCIVADVGKGEATMEEAREREESREERGRG